MEIEMESNVSINLEGFELYYMVDIFYEAISSQRHFAKTLRDEKN